MRATLFGVPGSHPALGAELMLRRKGIDYRRVDLVGGVHRALVRALGFPGDTVPALRLDGQRLQGTRTIALALDALLPEPRLLPAEPERRAATERAESWGDEVLQTVARRIVWGALKRDRSDLETYLADAHLGIPPSVAARTAAPIVALAARLNHASDDAVRRDLEGLPKLLDHVDELLGAGTIGGDEPTVADYQIATSVRLLGTLDDVRPLLDGRPAATHALRIVPRYPGHTGPALPSEWLPA